MLLIYPPVAKPCEPPAGIAKLSGALKSHDIRHSVLDANLEGLLFLMDSATSNPKEDSDTWTRRAVRNYAKNICSLRDLRLFLSIDRYSRAVMDINRLIEKSVETNEVMLSLANYQDCRLSPLRSSDLLQAASRPEANPFYPYFSNRISGLIDVMQPGIAGISINYLSQALCAFAMMGFLKREFPGLNIICGGGLVTSWLRRPGWSNPFAGLIDHFVEGPGEDKLLKLAGINEKAAVHYRPDYGPLPVANYLSPGAILPYSGSSGCFWNHCTFCPEKAEGNCYVPVGIKQAKNDISSLVTHMKPSLIHLLDNAVSPALIKALIDNPPGAPWYGFARITPELTDMDYCMKLKRSGCVMLKLGIESGDQAVLDRMRKGVDISIASRALQSLKCAGITTYVYLLFGTPEETLEGARKTLDFTVKHSREIGFLNLAIFNMPVGAPESRTLQTTDFYEGDLSLYTDFRHPAGWNRKDVRLFVEREFKKNKAVSSILKNEPPFFTSNHAAFFSLAELHKKNKPRRMQD
jgi:radical SAM superfamily enzyme YgiQ (UPF0313 family)